MAPIGGQHELIISHGNDPQIGPLALGETAYAAGLRRAAKATSIAHRPSLAGELGRVHAELERLRAILREHGIEPGAMAPS